MDVSQRCTQRRAARGEVYMTAERARKALQGPGVVVMYTSGVRVVDWPCVRSPLHSLSQQGPTIGYTLVPSPKNGQNTPSFLIDTVFDEVSQDCIPDLLNLVPVLLNLGPVIPPYQANRVPSYGQMRSKQCRTVPRQCHPLQHDDELHQKDLRIIP